MTRVVLHIGRLVLRGIDRSDVAVVAAGVRAELRALLAEPGAAGALTAHSGRAAVHAGTARVPHGAGPAAVGRAVAGQIVQPRRRT
jgi:hypothetical protein